MVKTMNSDLSRLKTDKEVLFALQKDEYYEKICLQMTEIEEIKTRKVYLEQIDEVDNKFEITKKDMSKNHKLIDIYSDRYIHIFDRICNCFSFDSISNIFEILSVKYEKIFWRKIANISPNIILHILYDCHRQPKHRSKILKYDINEFIEECINIGDKICYCCEKCKIEETCLDCYFQITGFVEIIKDEDIDLLFRFYDNCSYISSDILSMIYSGLPLEKCIEFTEKYENHGFANVTELLENIICNASVEFVKYLFDNKVVPTRKMFRNLLKKWMGNAIQKKYDLIIKYNYELNNGDVFALIKGELYFDGTEHKNFKDTNEQYKNINTSLINDDIIDLCMIKKYNPFKIKSRYRLNSLLLYDKDDYFDGSFMRKVFKHEKPNLEWFKKFLTRSPPDFSIKYLIDNYIKPDIECLKIMLKIDICFRNVKCIFNIVEPDYECLDLVIKYAQNIADNKQCCEKCKNHRKYYEYSFYSKAENILKTVELFINHGIVPDTIQLANIFIKLSRLNSSYSLPYVIKTKNLNFEILEDKLSDTTIEKINSCNLQYKDLVPLIKFFRKHMIGIKNCGKIFKAHKDKFEKK